MVLGLKNRKIKFPLAEKRRRNLRGEVQIMTLCVVILKSEIVAYSSGNVK